jgi:hypothetical protein
MVLAYAIDADDQLDIGIERRRPQCGACCLGDAVVARPAKGVASDPVPG